MSYRYILAQINFLSRLTWKRVLNALKVTASYYVSKWTKNPVIWGMPVAVSIEPTTACNLGCPQCPSGLRQFSRDTGNIKEDFFTSAIDQLAERLVYLTFYFQGEPYIHPKFLSMVSYASQKGIYTATSTNAHFITDETARQTIESGLDRIIISIDGTSQETYQKYRIAGNLEKVLNGTRHLIAWRKKLKRKNPEIVFQFVAFRHNEHQIEEVKKLGKSIGVDDVLIKTAQIYDYKNGGEMIPEDENYSRYKQNHDGSYSINNPLLNHCWRMWHSCVITWDGLVVPCCFDKDATHRLGDLKTKNFRDVWKSDKYDGFRASLLKSRKEIDICTNCTEGTKVWA